MAEESTRGYGQRTKGAVYLETPLSAFRAFGGRAEGVNPVDDFLQDPPSVGIRGAGLYGKRLDALTRRQFPHSLNKVVRGITTHLVDWVDPESYPNVTDFIEEARHKGLSRRVAPELLGHRKASGAGSMFADLGPDSRLLLVHPRAYVLNALDFWRALQARNRAEYPLVPCPSATWGGPNHPEMAAMDIRIGVWRPLQTWCLGACFHDVLGERIRANVPRLGHYADRVRATVGDLQYHAYARPAMTEPLRYARAIFAVMPIAYVTVVRDPDDERGVAILVDQLRAQLEGGIEVRLEDP